MDIEILEYIPDAKNFRKGYVDFKIDYGHGKWELFRQVAYFNNDKIKWLSIGSIQRDGKWLFKYEREPSLNIVLSQVITALDKFITEATLIDDPVANPLSF